MACVNDHPERGRFAPSPTGPLHFGSLIAAVGSYLDARSRDGEWLVRIEDVDTTRVVKGAADAILRTLDAYGLQWDGPVIYQSRRTEFYREALAHLDQLGLTYPCTCSRREIAQIADIGPAGMVYPGTCRTGVSHPERAAAIRLRTDDREICFKDRIQGRQSQRLATEAGDFVIRRADELFTYQLVVVVDDGLQNITDIVRGSDLLEVTPRQIYLQRLLGFATPRYAHLPIAVDRRRAKLSKQTQAPPLDDRCPTPALFAALRFLKQEPPAVLARDNLATLWQWALSHWRPQRIPRTMAKYWPPH